MNKEDIRYKIRSRKCLMTDDERLLISQKVLAMLENSAAFMLSNNILMYHSLDDEVFTHSFIDKWNTHKNFFLPRVNGFDLEILSYDKSNLRSGAFKIEEPEGNEIHDIEDIELIIVPAVALDRSGNRIGRGKGFYDRLLKNAKATKIGIIYDFQLIDNIPAEAHDITVDYIITENEIIRTTHSPISHGK